MAPNIFTMDIERDGVKRHPFHLGTDRAVAETFVYEELGKEGVVSVALRCNNALVRIFDWRDLAARQQENQT